MTQPLRISLLVLVLCVSLSGLFSEKIHAQELSFDQFKEWVIQYHPTSRAAMLSLNQNDLFRQQARGAFDPKLYGDYDRKDFDEKNYYQIAEGGIKIPTPIGAEVKVGYQHTQGIFLNPENNLPSAGQASIGLSVPLLQGLTFDDRRFGLQQAKVDVRMNTANAQVNMNKLVLEAGKAYYNWTYHFQAAQIRARAVSFAEERFEATRQSFLQGAKPAMDTLESLILLQDRQIILRQALLDLENARVLLSNWLWDENGAQVELNRNVGPNDWTIDPSSGLPIDLESLLTADHPENTLAQAKVEMAEWQRRLKAESLKPTLDVEYFLISDGFNLNPSSNTDLGGFNQLITDNYKVGVTFEMPLLFRKERAGVQLSDIKIAQNEMAREQKQVLIQNKQLIYLEQIQQLTNQIAESIRVVENYQSLTSLEIEKFQIGESSIFLVNSREQKLIEAQMKLQKQYAEFQKAKLGFQESTNSIAPITQ